MTNTLTGALVGAHFRPPAKLVLECLASGTSLALRAEPLNEYDEFAIAVLVSPSAIPASQHKLLVEELPLCGWDLEELLSQPELHLGYIAASKNKLLKEHPELVGNQVFCQSRELVRWEDCRISLGFGLNGMALVILVATNGEIK